MTEESKKEQRWGGKARVRRSGWDDTFYAERAYLQGWVIHSAHSTLQEAKAAADKIFSRLRKEEEFWY